MNLHTALDDRTYDDLVREAIAALPALDPTWTDHNPSDPGITLVELFAWLVEMMIYRTGRTSEQTVRAFLRLIAGTSNGDQPDLDALVRTVLADVRDPFRAVTTLDYETLARSIPNAQILRARTFINSNLEGLDPLASAPGHISLLVLPPTKYLLPDAHAAVVAHFAGRHLITTSFHVVGPKYRAVSVAATVQLANDVDLAAIRGNLESHLRNFLDPLTGGRDGDGWPFGRAVRATELMAELDAVPGVEAVTKLDLGEPPRDTILLDPHELPRATTLSFTLLKRLRAADEWSQYDG